MHEEHSNSLKVIGAGFGRTGTKSLQSALVTLGFGPCHHMFDVIGNRDQVDWWRRASQGDAAALHDMLAGYTSQVDWPCALYWRELSELFPDAKVILTIREPLTWHHSFTTTIVPKVAARASVQDPVERQRLELIQDVLLDGFFEGKISDVTTATDIFAQHVKAVKSEIAPERLLVFDVQSGWAPLCDFLGVAAPAIPFPLQNTAQEFNGNFKNRTVER